MIEILKATYSAGDLVFWLAFLGVSGRLASCCGFQMRLLIIPNAWAIAVANDHYGGDGRKAPRHGLYN